MSVRLNDFVSSSFAAFSLNRATQLHQRALARLSSGSRITETQDDAGGIAVAFKFGTELKRLNASVGNFQNGLSFLQTQDAALGQMGNLLSRMSELKTLSQDPTKSSTDIQNYQTEYIQLEAQFSTIKNQSFNGISVFSTSTQQADLSLVDSQNSITVSRPLTSGLTSGDTLNVSADKYKVVDQFTGQYMEHFQLTGTSVGPVNSDAFAASVGASVAVPANTQELLAIGKLLDENSNDMAQIDPSLSFYNQYQTSINNGTDLSDVIGHPYTGAGYFVIQFSSVSLSEVSSADIASSIQQVATARAQNGAEQSSLNNRIDSMQSRIVNLDHARSEIQDTDVAKAVGELGRTNILMQSASAMLTQANNLNRDMILRLLS